MQFLLNRFIVILLVGLAYVISAVASDDGVEPHEIGNGVYSFSSVNEGIHSMFVVGKDNVAVFETFHSDHATKLLNAVRGVTDKPIKYAFISHNHWDHASGGQVFSNAGAQTIMHQLAADWLKANPGQDTAAPDITWSGDSEEFDLGDFKVKLHYLGLNHGLGMTVFTVPERSAAYLADLVTPNRVMFAVVPDFNISEWERSLGEVLELEFDVAVCSHNALPPQEAINGCTRTHVEEERQFIRDLRAAIITEFQKGTAFMEIPQAIKLPKYDKWFGYNEWLEMNTYRLMTDLFMGPFPWIPNAQ